MADAVLPDGLRARYDEVYDRLLATYAQAVADCKHTNETNHPKRAAPSHPYFIAPPPDYKDSKYKVMVVGQETRGWYCHKDWQFTKQNATVDQLLDAHADGFKDPKKPGWRGTFRNGCMKLRKQLEIEFGCDPAQISFITNNVLKVGKHKGNGRPCDCVIQWQHKAGCMDLLREEIFKYYKPTHLVFFTGPNYDQYLDKMFPDLKRARASDVFTERQVAMVSSPDLGNVKVVRTYHPGYPTRTSKLPEYIAAVAKSLA
jgi:hypothetical protein